MTTLTTMIACQDAHRKGFRHLAAGYRAMIQRDLEREAQRVMRQTDINAELYTEGRQRNAPRFAHE